MDAKLSKEGGGYDLYRIDEDGKRVTFASTQDYKQKLSLKNCQAIENGYDLDELAKKACPDVISSANSAYKAGFQKALEILGDKKFTYNQMVSAITESSISHRLPSLIIQDLQQTEWNVEVEMEEVLITKARRIGFNMSLDHIIPKPLHDADGCLILKRK